MENLGKWTISDKKHLVFQIDDKKIYEIEPNHLKDPNLYYEVSKLYPDTRNEFLINFITICEIHGLQEIKLKLNH
jgi:hypothetical protein